MSYADTHASVRTKVGAKGKAVTFTKVTQTTDPETGVATAASVTVAGFAIQVRPNPVRYRELGLVESNVRTLAFAPATYGSEPEMESTVSWGGQTLTVRAVDPMGPDGTMILARVIVEK